MAQHRWGDVSRTETLAERIRRARFELAAATNQKVSQEKLGALIAEQLGRPQPISGATVSRWESGDALPDLEALRAIAVACKVDPGWLAFGNESAAPSPWARVPVERLYLHERRLQLNELAEQREFLIRQAAEIDREHRQKLLAELEEVRKVDTRESRRRIHEIIREMERPGQLQLMARMLDRDDSDDDDDRDRGDDFETDEQFEERMARYEAEEDDAAEAEERESDRS